MKGGFRQVVTSQIEDTRSVSQRMIEKSMHMRALAYLAEVKASLLTQTIFEIGKDKKDLSYLNRRLKYEHNNLEKQVEQRTKALSESETRLNDAQQIAHIGSWELDLTSNKLSWSDEVFRIFEMDMDRFDVSYDVFMETIHPDDRQTVNRAYTQSLEMRQPHSIDHRLLFSDGRIKWVHEQCKSMFSEDGKPLRSLGTVQDITERKQVEDELSKHRNHLEELVGARTHELAEANAHLKDLDRMKSMFIASMSHELRTPMNSILGFTDLILQGLSGEINAIQRDQLQRVHGAGKHLLMLISDIIDLSKVEAGKIEAMPSDFELEPLLDEAVQANLVAARKKGLNLVLEPPAQSISMHTDRQRLLQCLLNLLSNAVKYSRQGSITISAQKIHEEVVIEIRDSGIGISEDQIARLFQPFVRFDSELSVKAGGTGLGLYLTRKLITELLAGSISVDSQPAVGSCFSLRLPCRLRDGKNRDKAGGKA